MTALAVQEQARLLELEQQIDKGRLAVGASATWDEIEETIADLEKMIGTLVIDKEARARLLRLREEYPASRCPAEAARLAGTTVSAVMAGEWAA